MILNETEVIERMESPLNLLNRLKQINNSHNNKNSTIVSLPPKSKDIIPDLEDKINFGSAKSKAMNIMISAMDELKIRLPEVEKPERLAAIAAEMGKIVNGVQARTEHDTRIGQIVVYAPQIVSEAVFETIDVSDMESV